MSQFLFADGRVQYRMVESLFFLHDCATSTTAPVNLNGEQRDDVIGWHVDDSVSGGHGHKFQKTVKHLRAQLLVHALEDC